MQAEAVSITPIELIENYLVSLTVRARSGAISHRTLITYTQGMTTYRKTVGAEAPVSIETYIQFLKKLDTVSPSSVRTYKAAVLDFYKFCRLEYKISVDWIDLQEATKRYTQKATKTLVQFDEQAVDKLIAYCLTLKGSLLNLRNRALIITYVDTGFRNFEARGLLIGDINWETASTVIRGKGDKQAKVRFSPRAIQFIREYLEARAELDSVYPNRNALPLFARHDKSASTRIYPIGGGGVWAAIKAVCEDAGIDPASVWTHLLRHKYITDTYRRTGDIKKTKEFGRHASIDMTDRYTHLVESDLDETYNKIHA